MKKLFFVFCSLGTLFSTIRPMEAEHSQKTTPAHAVTIHNTTKTLCGITYEALDKEGRLQKILQVSNPQTNVAITILTDDKAGTVELCQRPSGQTQRWQVPTNITHLFIIAASGHTGFLIKNGTPIPAQ